MEIIWKSAIKIIKLQLYIRMSAWMFITILPVFSRILNSELWTFSFAHHAKCTSILFMAFFFSFLKIGCKWPALRSAWTYSQIEREHQFRPFILDHHHMHTKCCPVNSFMVFGLFLLSNYLNRECASIIIYITFSFLSFFIIHFDSSCILFFLIFSFICFGDFCIYLVCSTVIVTVWL